MIMYLMVKKNGSQTSSVLENKPQEREIEMEFESIQQAPLREKEKMRERFASKWMEGEK